LLAASRPLDGAVITNSGSTNAPGYEIRIHSDGSAQFGTHGRGVSSVMQRGTVSPTLAATFFADLKKARASNVQGEAGCMKSASFGTTTIVNWHGWVSGDLECPRGSPALKADIFKIQEALHIDASPGQPN
jgi:hypothetical protein